MIEPSGVLELKLAGRKFRLDLMLLVILVGAALVRLGGLDWGWTDFSPLPEEQRPAMSFFDFHPDESSNIRVARNFSQSDSWRPTGELYGQKLDYSLYGASTVYLHVLAVGFADLFLDFEPYDLEDPLSQKRTYLAVRWLTALLGLACIPLLYAAAHSLYDRRTARLAAAFLAFAAFHAQSGRFGTVDIPMVFFTLWSFLHSARLLKRASWPDLVFAAAAAGLAVATKVNALLVVFPLVAAELLRETGGGEESPGGVAADEGRPPRIRGLQEHVTDLLRRLLGIRLLSAGLITVGVFFLLNPYAILDYRNFLFADHAFGLFHIIRNVRGEFFYPFQIQFQEIRPFLFMLGNVLWWSAGPLLEIAGLLGALWMLLRRRRGDLVVLAWLLPAFAMTAAAQVMFMRYALPFLPLLALAAARLCAGLWEGRFLPGERPLPAAGILRWAARLAVTAVLLASLGWSWALASVHSVEDSRISAGRYLLERLPAGTSLLHERSANTIKSVIHMPRYENVCLEIPTVYRADGALEAEKLDFLADRLRLADWAAILESNRKLGYERNTRYHAERRFYEELFAQRLGFARDTVFQRLPRVPGFEVDDEAAEFSLRYYDHEEIHVFRKTDPAALEAGIAALKEDLLRRGIDPDASLARARDALERGDAARARELAVAGLDSGRGAGAWFELLAAVFEEQARRDTAAGRGAEAREYLRQASRFYSESILPRVSPLGRERRLLGFANFLVRSGDPRSARDLILQARDTGVDSAELRHLEAELARGPSSSDN